MFKRGGLGSVGSTCSEAVSLHLEPCSLCVRARLVYCLSSWEWENGCPYILPGEQFQPPKKCLSQYAYRNSLLEACARPLDLPLSPEAWGLWFGGCAHVARGKVHCFWRFSGTRSGGGVPQKKGGGVPEEKEKCACWLQIITTTVYIIDNTCKTVFKLFTGFRMGLLNIEKYSNSRLFVQVSFSGIGVFKAPHLQLLFYTIYRESILCPVFVLWNTYIYLLYLCFCK